ncbi:MAG: hypothetical protein DWI59_01785 [Chloroflexi bacterium]|nr:MAG: hypothetical protein DWI59_01785 [Chloroflexota bacterium]
MSTDPDRDDDPNRDPTADVRGAVHRATDRLHGLLHNDDELRGLVCHDDRNGLRGSVHYGDGLRR